MSANISIHRAEARPSGFTSIQEEGKLSDRSIKRREDSEKLLGDESISPLYKGSSDEKKFSIEDQSGTERRSSSLRKAKKVFVSSHHPFKLEKYTQILDQYVKALGGADAISLCLENLEGKSQKILMAKPLTNVYRILAGQGDYKNDRDRYQSLVKELRTTIESKQYQIIHNLPESKIKGNLAFCVRATKSIVQARWFKPEMYDYLKSSTDLYLSHSKASSGDQSFSKRFMEANQVVKDTPRELKKSHLAKEKQKLEGAVGLKDFSGTENVPFVRCRYHYRNTELEEERVIEYMRHSRPTVGGNALQFIGGVASRAFNSLIRSDRPSKHDGETIASDYEEAIQFAAERGEAIFYVVHQRRTPGGVENEADSTKLIEKLDGKYENFHTLIQSVEGPLFEQEGKYAIKPSGSSLKSALIDSFVSDKNSPNRLPNAVRTREEYHQSLGDLFNHAFATFYPRRDMSASLTSEEWKEMTLFFYVMQKDDLKFRLSNDDYTVKYYTTPCKDFLDRGGNMAMVEDFVHYHMTAAGPTDQDRDHTLYTTLGTPILVKKKEAIPARFTDGLRVVERLENGEHDQEALQGAQFHGWKLDRVEYPA